MLRKLSKKLRLHGLAGLAVVMVIVCALLAATAYATTSSWTTGFYGWTVDTTSNYASNAGRHAVKGNVHTSCTSHNYKIRVVRVRTLYPDVFYDYQNYPRNTPATRNWNGLPSGTFHLNVACTYAYCDFYWSGSGHVAHP